MNKDQEILAISRLVFELTKIGDADPDQMLGRLFNLLSSLPGIRMRPQGVILLNNARNHPVQVAQHGLPPLWAREQVTLDGPALSLAGPEMRRAFVATPASLPTPLEIAGVPGEAPCFVLPILDDRLRGLALLFIDPDWQPDAVETEFMSDLAQALTVLISRCVINETLKVREVELEYARTDAIQRLGSASEYRDNDTGMHIMRMTHFAGAIAKAMNLPAELRELLIICAPMHDVGKIGIPDAILLKPGKLSVEEFEIMKAHTEIGRDLLTGEDNLIQAAREIASCHHERWDGSGYPAGLAGEDIPLLARICAVSDVFDALTSSRPYKEAWSVEEAVAWVREQSGGHFDPAVVAAFDRALPEILRIRELYRDDIIDPNQSLNLPETQYRDSHWVAWNDELSVGIDIIDEHHRYLFDLTNDLFEVVASKRSVREVARVLKSLDQYAQVHFRAEERMMRHYGYEAMSRQEHQHAAFEQRLRGFYNELHNNPLIAKIEVLIYLRRWLVSHILHEDAQLRSLVTPLALVTPEGA